jgi:hypothetical protein
MKFFGAVPPRNAEQMPAGESHLPRALISFVSRRPTQIRISRGRALAPRRRALGVFNDNNYSIVASGDAKSHLLGPREIYSQGCAHIYCAAAHIKKRT